MELKEIKGYEGFKLQGIFYSMLSLYALKNLQAQPNQFIDDYDKEENQEKRKQIMLNMVKTTDSLDKDDLAFLCSFAKDKNGIPYSKNTVPSLSVDEINEIIVNLFDKFLKISLFFSQKKTVNK